MNFYLNLLIMFLIMSAGFQASDAESLKRNPCRIDCMEYCQNRGRIGGKCSRKGACICQRPYFAAYQ